MKIETQELNKILTNLKPGLAQKDITEQMSHFVFTGSNIVTYNDQIYISHPFKTSFKTSVKAQELLQLLQKVNGKTTTINLEKDQLKIKCGKASAGFATLEEGQTSKPISELEKQLTKVKWRKLPKQFNEGLSLTMFSASQDMMCYSNGLTSVYINKDSMISCDRYRAGVYTLNDEIKDEFLLSAAAIPELLKLNPSKHCLTKSWINFKNKEGVVFSVKKIKVEENQNKSVEEYFNNFKKKKKKLKLPQDELLSAIGVGAVIEQGRVDIEKRVKIEIDEGKLIVSSKRETGWVETSIKVEYSGEPFTFQINPQFFLDILKHVTTIYIGEDKVFFTSGNFKHLVLFYAEE